MNRLLTKLREDWMYWRFRNITRNRLRLQSWWNRRRQPTPVAAGRRFRPPGGAAWVYRRSSGRSWIALLVMVAILTALQKLGSHGSLNGTLVYAFSALAIVGAIYWALRGV